MNNSEFMKKLIELGFYNQIYKNVTNTILLPLSLDDDVLNLLNIYFVLKNDGNCCMPLDEGKLKTKWNDRCKARSLILLEGELTDKEVTTISDQIKAIKDAGEASITNKNIEAIQKLDIVVNEEDIASKKYEKILFIIKKNYLYTREYYQAVKNIQESIDRLFKDIDDGESYETFEIDKYLKEKRKLKDGQKQIIEKGKTNNLIITGGPGTGKTTSICYLLLSILKGHPDFELYLTAPSGKAADRISESIISSLTENFVDLEKFIKDSNLEEVYKKLSESSEYTIHRLLGHDYSINDFKYNDSNKFGPNSIFIIDEASMIDVCLFSSLLQSIPDSARVFILGDKNQLPSVEAGAVFDDLYEHFKEDKKHFVELDESVRFEKGTELYELANVINMGGSIELTTKTISEPDETIHFEEDKNALILYSDVEFRDNIKRETECLEKVLCKWKDAFYKTIKTDCSSLTTDDLDDKGKLEKIFSYVNSAKILCAQNRGIRGVEKINKLIKTKVYGKDSKEKPKDYFPGLIMMITQNDKLLHLYNGNTGIIVNIKDGDEDILYFMIKKESKYFGDGYNKDNIFAKNGYLFYPIRMISGDIITLAYAITIHKSQGSDYGNVFVILPKEKTHPLVTKQIVYTAITRTKGGSTYIYSNLDTLNYAKDNKIIRDTRIFD